MISLSARQGTVLELSGLQARKMSFDQTGGIIVADGDRARALPTLISVEQVKSGVATLINAEAGHVSSCSKGRELHLPCFW